MEPRASNSATSILLSKHLHIFNLAFKQLPMESSIFAYFTGIATIGHHAFLNTSLLFTSKHAQQRKGMHVLLFAGTTKMHEVVKFSLEATYE